jgi:hypothetical protein
LIPDARAHLSPADMVAGKLARLLRWTERTAARTTARAVAFDVDTASLASLRRALPGWHIEVVSGATAVSLPWDWHPGAADLLVVAVGGDLLQTLGLCRFLASRTPSGGESRQAEARTSEQRTSLRNQPRVAGATLLVLVPSGEETLAEAAFQAGAQGCLMLPLDAAEVAGMLADAWAGHQPGRHTLDLERARREDRWRDDGGQG